jgi:hypothetical protein
MATKCSRFYFQLVPSTLRTEGIEFGLLPTVTTSPATSSQTIEATETLLNRLDRNRKQGQLMEYIVMKMLPTPAMRDANNAEYPDKYQKRKEYQMEKGVNLEYPLRQWAMDQNPTGKTSQLSPQFVMEMMGFPTDWTLLPFLNGETNPSKQEVTQSFPK